MLLFKTNLLLFCCYVYNERQYPHLLHVIQVAFLNVVNVVWPLYRIADRLYLGHGARQSSRHAFRHARAGMCAGSYVSEPLQPQPEAAFVYNRMLVCMMVQRQLWSLHLAQ